MHTHAHAHATGFHASALPYCRLAFFAHRHADLRQHVGQDDRGVRFAFSNTYTHICYFKAAALGLCHKHTLQPLCSPFSTPRRHYTCHTKSVITKPQNVLVLRDIMCAGYVASGNTLFFGEGAGSFTPENVTRAMTKRLAFEDDASGEYESMLAFAVPYGSMAKRDQVVSISARLLPWEVATRAIDQHAYFPGGPGHYAFYSQALNLDSVHFGEDIRAAENMEFISQARCSRDACLLCVPLLRAPFARRAYACLSVSLCRAPSTTRCASSARTASTPSGQTPSTSSCPARATSGPTRSPE